MSQQRPRVKELHPLETAQQWKGPEGTQHHQQLQADLLGTSSHQVLQQRWLRLPVPATLPMQLHFLRQRHFDPVDAGVLLHSQPCP